MVEIEACGGLPTSENGRAAGHWSIKAYGVGALLNAIRTIGLSTRSNPQFASGTVIARGRQLDMPRIVRVAFECATIKDARDHNLDSHAHHIVAMLVQNLNGQIVRYVPSSNASVATRAPDRVRLRLQYRLVFTRSLRADRQPATRGRESELHGSPITSISPHHKWDRYGAHRDDKPSTGYDPSRTFSPSMGREPLLSHL